MSEHIRLNGSPVATSGGIRRSIVAVNEHQLARLDFALIVRGKMARRSLVELLSREPVQVDVPTSQGWDSFQATIADVLTQSTGTGESAAHRFDVSLRETRESSMRRANATATADAAREREAAQSAAAAERPADDLGAADSTAVADKGLPDGPIDLSSVTTHGDGAVLQAALRQLRPPSAPAPAPEPPLSTLELAGIEAVLVSLRVEAVIDQLVAQGLVRRSLVEASFQHLVNEHFVKEATPIVGATVAERVLREREA